MALEIAGRPRRKWAAVALLSLLLALFCACLVDETSAYKHRAVAVDEDDEDDEEDDDGFDFMSTKLATPRTQSNSEFACDDAGTGECVASASPSTIKSVIARGLVTTKPRVKDIIREHTRVTSDAQSPSSFGGEVLGYVTPWNARGYAFATQFRSKFTYLSPVWLQIREDGTTKTPILTGTHDIDRKWIQAVRGDEKNDGVGPKIVPRVMYERNKLSSDDVPVIIDLLLSLAKQEKFDGVVFEIPIAPGTMDILLRVGEAFREAKLLLLLVISRSSNYGQLPVTHEMLDQLLPVVHRFTMNAYDYQTPGPNAPFDWIQATLNSFREKDRAKVLMGLPFYGYDNNDAIVGTTYIEQLTQYDGIKIRWDAAAHECVHQYTSERGDERRTVYFPCLQFLQDRLQLFQQSGLAGTAVWELGQGLEYFYDLL